jgi:hypothetical protein
MALLDGTAPGYVTVVAQRGGVTAAIVPGGIEVTMSALPSVNYHVAATLVGSTYPTSGVNIVVHAFANNKFNLLFFDNASNAIAPLFKVSLSVTSI